MFIQLRTSISSPFYGQVIFRRVARTHFVYPFDSWWTLGYFRLSFPLGLTPCLSPSLTSFTGILSSKAVLQNWALLHIMYFYFTVSSCYILHSVSDFFSLTALSLELSASLCVHFTHHLQPQPNSHGSQPLVLALFTLPATHASTLSHHSNTVMNIVVFASLWRCVQFIWNLLLRAELLRIKAFVDLTRSCQLLPGAPFHPHRQGPQPHIFTDTWHHPALHFC